MKQFGSFGGLATVDTKILIYMPKCIIILIIIIIVIIIINFR